MRCRAIPMQLDLGRTGVGGTRRACVPRITINLLKAYRGSRSPTVILRTSFRAPSVSPPRSPDGSSKLSYR